MFKFNEVVLSSAIWPNTKDHVDYGYRCGYVRGYNIEVQVTDGSSHWLSACYIADENPEEYFNDEFHLWMYQEHGWTPTGRICFRGYGVERYDPDERDTFVYMVEDDEVR